MEHHGSIRILGISGSLRRSSSNSTLLAAAARLAPAGAEVSIFGGLGDIPPFNPDLEQEETPEAISTFRDCLNACQAVMISSPEYAHGVPGVLKNALDWIVGSGELVGKPVALINSSARATHAWASLLETLTVMSARVIADASITVVLPGRGVDVDGIAADDELAAQLRGALDALVAAAQEQPDH